MIHIYQDEGLRKVWLGYITILSWVIFIPADGGKPSVFEAVQ